MSITATKKPAASAPDAHTAIAAAFRTPPLEWRLSPPTAKREARAVICEIDVPESRIDERILPLLKEITQEAPSDGE
jgi:hypothetical protein